MPHFSMYSCRCHISAGTASGTADGHISAWTAASATFQNGQLLVPHFSMYNCWCHISAWTAAGITFKNGQQLVHISACTTAGATFQQGQLLIQHWISDPVLPAGHSGQCFPNVLCQECLTETVLSVWVPFPLLSLLELWQLAYLQY